MMKKFLLLGPLLLAVMSGCKNGNDTIIDAKAAEADKLVKLQEQFHGKYKIVSATADEDIDVNMDGVASTNLLNEIPSLKSGNNSHIVELRIYGPSPAFANTSFLLSQSWPEQYIYTDGKEWDGGSALNYKSDLSVNYMNQGTTRNFGFSEDLKEITVQPNEKENPFRWAAPKSVRIDESGRLHFVNKRYLYTKEGVKEVTIQCIYERFTTAT